MKHALQLETSYVGFESLRIGIDVARRSFVALALRGGTVDLDRVGGQLRPFAPQLLRSLGLRPDGRVFQLATNLFQSLFLIVVLKETPVRRRCAPRGL
jgi:hypothetical protein